MNIVNIRLLNSRNSSKSNNRFIESGQFGRTRKRNFNKNHNQIPELPIKLDKTNSLLFSPVISFEQNRSIYFNKNYQYGLFQISSKKIAGSFQKPKNVFLTTISNLNSQKSNNLKEGTNLNAPNEIKSTKESNQFKIHHQNKIKKSKK